MIEKTAEVAEIARKYMVTQTDDFLICLQGAERIPGSNRHLGRCDLDVVRALVIKELRRRHPQGAGA